MVMGVGNDDHEGEVYEAINDHILVQFSYVQGNN